MLSQRSASYHDQSGNIRVEIEPEERTMTDSSTPAATSRVSIVRRVIGAATDDPALLELRRAEQTRKQADREYNTRVKRAQRQVKQAAVSKPLGIYKTITLYPDSVKTAQGAHPMTSAVQATVDTAGNLVHKSRSTLTRMGTGAVIAGPLGLLAGAAARKGSTKDLRELYLMIEGPDWSTTVECDPADAKRVREFAQAINVAARTAETSREQRAQANAAATYQLRDASADRAGLDAAQRAESAARAEIVDPATGKPRRDPWRGVLPDRGLNALLSIVTLGVWVPVWIVLFARVFRRGWRGAGGICAGTIMSLLTLLFVTIVLSSLGGDGAVPSDSKRSTEPTPRNSAPDQSDAPTRSQPSTAAAASPPPRPPQRRTTPSAAPTARPGGSASQRFYEKIDDNAIALDDAIERAQNGQPQATQAIARLRASILAQVNSSLLAGGDTSIGGNLLLSAATTAQSAARSEDVARLADARRGVAEARTVLAEEATAS